MSIDVKDESAPQEITVGVDPAQPGAEDEVLGINVQLRRSELISLAEEGGEMVLNPQAEEAIIKLLELQTLVDSTLGLIKDQIVHVGQGLSPDFTTVAGDRLKCNYQFSGAVYSLEKGRKEFPAPLFKREVKVSINSKAMAEYEKEHRRLPKYVKRAARKQSLQFKVRG